MSDAAQLDPFGGLGDPGDALSERVLNQDEIDSLLGFDLGDDDGAERSGIRAIINSALVSYERLPMLEIVFDRLVRLMTTSLRNFTSDNVEVSLDNISSIRFGDYLNSIPLPAILAVFRAEELDNYGLLTVDSNLIYSIVDVLLGGRRGTAALRIEGRPYTTIGRGGRRRGAGDQGLQLRLDLARLDDAVVQQVRLLARGAQGRQGVLGPAGGGVQVGHGLGECQLAGAQGRQLAFQLDPVTDRRDQQQHQHRVHDHSDHQRPPPRRAAVSGLTGPSTRTAIC